LSGDTRELWFVIEQTISELDQLCEKAKADELRSLRRAQEGSWLPGGSAGASGVEVESPTEEASASGAWGGAVAGADVVGLRAALRERLQLLREFLSHRLTEREVYYCLFPIVIYTDELVHSAIGQRSKTWAPLQQELYEIDNGGELFYTLVDTLLGKSETLPLIFEVFYFCLRDGFVGALENNAVRLEEYMSRLKLRIPVAELSKAESDESEFDQSIELVDFPKSYYAMAAGIMIGFYGVLQFFGRY